MFHKIVTSFKKLGLGTPPLKKREKRNCFLPLKRERKEIVSIVTGLDGS